VVIVGRARLRRALIFIAPKRFQGSTESRPTTKQTLSRVGRRSAWSRRRSNEPRAGACYQFLIQYGAMPTYEYACSKCGHHFDLFQPITDPSLSICPKEKCARQPWAKGKVKRVIGAGGGLIFKGTGFYTTDYRSEKYKEAANKDAPATTGSTAAAADAKPAADKSQKTEAKPQKPSGGKGGSE